MRLQRKTNKNYYDNTFTKMQHPKPERYTKSGYISQQFNII